ncbi:bifunctional adenosylcobinamide kinase/adenosylcobinamide-phosphate guanylyltransferase [Calidifontibacter indicus]|uniref:Adenosylcobinamide kinase n=1 Tax=Calidifontibacter indicus TaxID=419650 RepID=A0A3D9V2W6_9MICO|nr:bifunctional adenosylcobinamide kinase/adenosylcobinamide-phosphate guanylyltransferase [Calidifontibacter indicus]REF31471.1 adenosylcobinamide kinase /adenosylcobinamide-phosphate guanylyltransferase [Calidifontibacter indicus]
MATTLVLGGTRSGKTRHARSLLPTGAYTVIDASADGHDHNDGVHGPREDVVTGAEKNVVRTLDVTRSILRSRNPVLVDCLGTWVVGLLDEWQSWDDLTGSLKRVEDVTYELAALWADAPFDTVAVSHEVSFSPVPVEPRARVYQETLGRVNAIISEASRRTHVVIAGRILDLSNAPVVR